MPGIEDWAVRPYTVIQKIFEENKSNSHDVFVQQVQEYFSQRLDHDAVLKIPSLNIVNTDQLTSGALVRYRCMVQDVFDPQFCLAQYTVRNNKTQTARIECGAFKDISNVGPEETVDFDSRDNVPVERQGFYCVPIPGESDWVKEMYSKACPIMSMPQSRSNTKRMREEEGVLSDQKSAKVDVDSLVKAEHRRRSGEGTENENLSESQCSTNEPDKIKSKPHHIDMNHPLPGEKGLPCIVRVYSSDVELKTTDCVEFIGILSLDPELASMHDNQNEGEDITDQDELLAHEPPASLVPRIHAILVRTLDHDNPNLSPVVSSDAYRTGVNIMMNDICSLRMEMLSILEHVLLCDRLAAEYLLCHLISRVYARVDALPLGKFSLNLSGCPNFQRYSKFLYYMISQLTTKSTLLEMSIQNLNSWKLVPKKDFNTNRVVAGILQLSSGTHMVLDETALEQGQLDNTGVLNVRALEDLIASQKVDYDFQWSAVPIHSDTKILILSEGPSFLSKDFHVPMNIDRSIVDVPAHFAKLDPRLTEENLNKLRSYVTSCCLSDYEVSDDLQKMMQEDFVETRQRDTNEMSVDDFRKLLTIVRYLTISYGKQCPTDEIWMKVKAMESERKERVARLPQPTNGSH